MSGNLEIACTKQLPVVWTAKYISNVCDPRLLRGHRGEKEYAQARQKRLISDLRLGWQENMFPYSVPLLMLLMLTGKDWAHYVYASEDSSLNTEAVGAWMKWLKVDSWIAFVNPETQRSQRIPHAHLIAPAQTIPERFLPF